MLRIEHPRLSLLDALIYGSTLSATDPVTILAIFNTYKVDPQLYSIIFGESILNDAVSIVMFDTLSQMRGAHLSIMSVLHGFGFFAVVFNVSMALGVLFGLFCSLLLKHTRLRLYKELECCVVLLVAYTSYFFSNAVEMSGIVSLLFCGITLKHYAYHNMSRRTQHMTKGIFQTLSNVRVYTDTALGKLYLYLFGAQHVYRAESRVPAFADCVYTRRSGCLALLLRLFDCMGAERLERVARRASPGAQPRTSTPIVPAAAQLSADAVLGRAAWRGWLCPERGHSRCQRPRFADHGARCRGTDRDCVWRHYSANARCAADPDGRAR